MANIRFNLRAVNVPDSLPHKARNLEIEELPDYLEVDLATLAGLSLVNFGADTPSADTAGLPWIKLNPDGSPNGIFIKHAGDWKRATPNVVEAEVSNLTVLVGSGTITFDAAAGTLMTRGPISSFTPDFDAPPLVFLSFAGGTVFNDATAWQDVAWKIDSRVDEFYIDFKCGVDCSSVNRDLNIQWMAIGVRS